MIDFELQSVYGGWGVIRTPDDVDFTLRTGDDTYEIWGSITELLELYARLRLEESGGVLLGSGTYGEIDVHENHFSLETHGTGVEGSLESPGSGGTIASGRFLPEGRQR